MTSPNIKEEKLTKKLEKSFPMKSIEKNIDWTIVKKINPERLSENF